MQKNESLNVSAKSVDKAIEQGLNQLGLNRDQVNIEIISEGKRSLFGFKSEDAVVKLTPKSETEAGSVQEEVTLSETGKPAPLESERASSSDSETVKSDLGAPEIEAPPKTPSTSTDGDDPNREVAKIGTEYLAGLLEHMGIKAEVKTRLAPDLVDPGEAPPLVLDVIGKDLGILIGRRNETLQALQYMVRLMVSKKMGGWQRIVVDVESYRSRRRRSLHQMAKRMADRAVANDERVVLEAMSAYERRLIHIALRDHPAVITKSVGRDKNRKVTIIPK